MKRRSNTHSRRLSSALAVACCCLLWVVAPAHAELDTFMLGDGHEGPVGVSTTGPLNYSAPIDLSLAAGSSSVTTGPGQSGAAGNGADTAAATQTQFEAGRLVLVIQSAGTLPGAISGAPGPFALAPGNIGRFELARIDQVSGDISSGMSITLNEPLEQAFSAPGAQLVAVPEFSDVTIEAGAGWSANRWDGASGGITAFLADGEVALDNSTSEISADAAGFRGGVPYDEPGTDCTALDGAPGGGKGEGPLAGIFPGTSSSNASRGNLANGAGGGDCERAGGGGGSNVGAGGVGGHSADADRDVGGLGGAPLSYSAIDHLTFGGGGGAGAGADGTGGSGGGLVFIRAGSVTGSGRISADGAAGADSVAAGAGGGGGGGLIHVRTVGAVACFSASATGGGGGAANEPNQLPGTGAGGGGGQLLIQSNNDTCSKSVSNGVAGMSIGGSFRGATPTLASAPGHEGLVEAPPAGGLDSPTSQIDTPSQDAQVADATPAISGSSSIPFAQVQITLDTANFTTTAGFDGAWSFTPLFPLAEGEHTVRARSIAFGIAGELSPPRVFTIDTVAPNPPTINSPSGNLTNDTTPLVVGTAEAGSSVRIWVDGELDPGVAVAGEFGAWSIELASPLEDGVHNFVAITTDAAGNVSPSSSAASVTVDSSPPAVAITWPSDGALINDRNPRIAFTSEPSSTTRCKLDGGAYSNCLSPFKPTNLADGAHTAFVEATDPAGNSAVALVGFTIDATRPVVTLTSGPSEDDYTNDPSAEFSFAANEPASFECSVENSSYQPCSSPFAPTIGPPADGPHRFRVRAIDVAGNYSLSTTRNWVIDTIAPAPPTILAPIDGQAVQLAAPILSGTTEPLAMIGVAVDGVAASETVNASPSGEWTFPTSQPLGDATHTFAARATDRAGNVSSYSAPLSVRIDAAIPVAQIQGKPALVSATRSSTFSFSASEVASFSCSVDGSPFSACEIPAFLSGMSEGMHTFAVIATDVSGNSSLPDSYSWRIDTEGPVISIAQNSPPPGVSPIVTFSSNEAGTTYRCRIRGVGAYITCASPFSIPTLPFGSYIFDLRATDSVGNTTQLSLDFEVKTTAVIAPPPSTPSTPTPTVASCSGFGESPATPPIVTLASPRATSKSITFSTKSDQAALLRVSLYRGSRLTATGVISGRRGRSKVRIKLKRRLKASSSYRVRLAALTLAGGKSGADATLTTDTSGRATLGTSGSPSGTVVQSAIDCGVESNARSARVKAAAASNSKASSQRIVLTLKPSEWVVARVEVRQSSKLVAVKTAVLRAGRSTKLAVRPSAGAQFASGRTDVQISTLTVDGLKQRFSRKIRLK